MCIRDRGLLIYQAMCAFEIWPGIAPDDDFEEELEKKLKIYWKLYWQKDE